ncbi:hypothetical protein [Streptococcus equinus]|uniref:hypothetical protein n=1 Tax=Streptococcus equinus TaxID=1335 RepID=UPI001FB4361D|nr:hypothetical protein [Streptococcus equinus]UOC10568.1 hypothetical protein KIP81_06580 [Streptococcus equinus]
MGEFIEKIAQVKIKDKNEEFAHFYGISKFPINFNLGVSITFLNLLPNKNYRLKINITEDTEPLTLQLSDTQSFSVPENDMILVHDGFGQTFITTEFLFSVPREGAYEVAFELEDDNKNKLSSFKNYYYFGGA